MTDQNNKKTLLKLRDVRREKGLTLNALAEKADMDYQKIGPVERGETQITIDTLQRLARVLEVPIIQLLDGSAIIQ